MGKLFSRTFVVASLAFLGALGGCERYALDQRMQELCAKDGGVKVYETVTLSASKYEELAKHATARNREDYFGPEYRLVEERRVLVGAENDPEKGRGRLARSYQAIYRRSDGRLLGESVSYGRTGGDGLTFGFNPSSNHCPKPRVSLQKSVFLKGE